MPTLPEPKTREVPGWNITYHSVDQMRAYGQACREQALEEAAQAALNAPIKTAMQPYREACANAIRSLK